MEVIIMESLAFDAGRWALPLMNVENTDGPFLM